MYKYQGFPGRFTIPLRSAGRPEVSLEKTTRTQVLILLQKDEKSDSNHNFLERLIESIPFLEDKKNVSILFLPQAPNWKAIKTAFPSCVFIFSIGFHYADLNLQLKAPFYQMVRFRSQFFITTPSLSEWKNNKQVKLHIWQQLKSIEKLPQ